MYRCDNAMRNQFISKARAAKEPSNKNANDLLASEIALIDCHDYDVFRKNSVYNRVRSKKIFL